VVVRLLEACRGELLRSGVDPDELQRVGGLVGGGGRCESEAFRGDDWLPV
jgi:hypothetical protein